MVCKTLGGEYLHIFGVYGDEIIGLERCHSVDFRVVLPLGRGWVEGKRMSFIHPVTTYCATITYYDVQKQ